MFLRRTGDLLHRFMRTYTRIVDDSCVKVTCSLNTKELALDFFTWAAHSQPHCVERESLWCIPDLCRLMEDRYGQQSESRSLAALQSGREFRIAIWEGDPVAAIRVLREGTIALLTGLSMQLDNPVFVTITEEICKAGHFRRGYWLVDHLQRSGKQDLGVPVVECLLSIFRLVGGLEKLSRMIEAGCKFETKAFHLIIDKMCKAGKVDEALVMMDKLQQSDVASCNTVFRALVASSRIQDAMDFLRKEGTPPCSNTYNAIIHVLLEQDKVDEALDVYQEAVDNGQVSSIISTLDLLFHGLVSDRRFTEALEVLAKYFDVGGVPGSTMSVNILDCLCHVGKLDEALEFFCRLVSEGCCLPADVLIRELSKAGRALDCLKVAKRLIDGKQLRERHIVNIAIDSLCKADMIDKAEAWFQELKQLRGILNTISYNTMINAFCNTERVDEAIQLFEEMKEAGCAPSTPTYNTLIRGLCRADRLGDAQHFYKLLRSVGPGASFITYNVMIDGFCKADRIPEAVKLLDELVARDGVVASAPYNSIIDSLFKSGKFDEAEVFFNRMVRDGVRPEEVTYTILIDAMCKANRIGRAKELFISFLDSGGSPTVVISSCLMDGLCKSGNVEGAWKIFELMARRGYSPNDVSCNILINGLCKTKRLSQARAVFDAVTKRQAKPDVVTYSTFMDGLCRAHKVDEAREVLRLLIDKGGIPDVVMYTALISGLCALGRLDEARRVFVVEMKASGCAPNNFTCNILLNGFGVAGRLDEARELFQKFVESGVQPDSRTFLVMANNTARNEGWDMHSWTEWISGYGD